jgi:ABC-2 type transport system permease protein
MNIFSRELKAYRKSLIIWCIGVLFMVAAGMGKYVTYSASGQSMNDLFTKFPRMLKAIFGMGTFDLSKAGEWFGMLFMYLLLMATIHAVLLGANIISKEEEDKTAEFLFVKPVSRNTIINSKLLAALVNITIFNIVTMISSIVLVGHYNKGASLTGDIVRLMIGMFIVQLIFMFIGTGIAAVSKNPKTAASAATGVLLFTYILSVVIDINDKLENLKYLTPFKYFDAKTLMSGGGFKLVFATLSVAIIAALLCVTYVFYNKRDLNI